MLEKHYQIFYSTSGEDTQSERLMLTQTLSTIGCFSWGLEQRTPLSSTLVRRHIDECDYVIMLIGGKYGEQSVTGESYMHLEYKYALSKNKPIIVFMMKNIEQLTSERKETHPKLVERFEQFCEELKMRHEVVYYQTVRDLEMNIRAFMPKFIEKHPQDGWVRATEFEQLKQKLQDLDAKIAKGEISKRTIVQPQVIKPVEQTEVVPQNQFAHLPKVALLNDVALDYRIHAYQDGNFSDVTLVRHLTWMQLIELFGQSFLEPTPEEVFSKCVNQYLNDTSLDEVKAKYPRVHAVARAQINLKTLKMIKEQLHHHEWFQPVGQDEKQRVLWQITEIGRKYFNG